MRIINHKLKVNNKSSGFSLVEAIIVLSVTGLFILVLSLINTKYLSYAIDQSNIINSNFLAEEGLEAVRFMRDDSWATNINTLTIGQEYYLYFGSGKWKATTTMQSNFPLFRTVRFDNVYRDGSDNIAQSGTLDSGTRLITTSVSWLTKTGTTTKTLSTYITNVFNN